MGEEEHVHIHHHLKKVLGPFDLVMLGIGATIGAGIFVLTGVAAREKAGPAVVLSFTIAALACVFDALCYAELSARFPMSGSAYLYASKVYGKAVGFVVGTQLVIEYSFGAAAVSQSLVQYLLLFFKDVGCSIPSWLEEGIDVGIDVFRLNVVAPWVILAITFLLCSGVEESSKFNSIVTGVSLLVILLVVFAGSTHVDTENWDDFMPKGFSGVVSGASAVFFAFVGFDAVSNAAEECKNPKRDMPIGIIGSLGVCALLYVAVSLVVTGMQLWSELDKNAPMSWAFEKTGMDWVRIIIDVGAFAALITTLLCGLYSQPRVYLGMARDGLIPRWFEATHRKFGTPFNAQVTCGVIGAFLSFFLDVEQLSEFLGIGLLLAYSVVCGSVVTLRANNPIRATQGMVVLSLTTLTAGFCFFYEVHWAATATFGALAVITMCSLGHLSDGFQSPSSDFSVPFIPILPCLGIMTNVWLMAHKKYSAWIRLLVVGLFAVGYHWWQTRNERSNGKDRCWGLADEQPLLSPQQIETLEINASK